MTFEALQYRWTAVMNSFTGRLLMWKTSRKLDFIDGSVRKVELMRMISECKFFCLSWLTTAGEKEIFLQYDYSFYSLQTPLKCVFVKTLACHWFDNMSSFPPATQSQWSSQRYRSALTELWPLTLGSLLPGQPRFTGPYSQKILIAFWTNPRELLCTLSLSLSLFRAHTHKHTHTRIWKCSVSEVILDCRPASHM